MDKKIFQSLLILKKILEYRGEEILNIKYISNCLIENGFYIKIITKNNFVNIIFTKSNNFHYETLKNEIFFSNGKFIFVIINENNGILQNSKFNNNFYFEYFHINELQYFIFDQQYVPKNIKILTDVEKNKIKFKKNYPTISISDIVVRLIGAKINDVIKFERFDNETNLYSFYFRRVI